MRLRHNEVNPI